MKSSFITIAGRPSSGKSTLLNRICGHKVSIVSSVPQTTRNRIRGIYTSPRGQLVFQDTPGYHISDKMINTQMRQLTESAVEEAELVLYVVDCTREPGDEEKNIISYLAAGSGPVVVAVNKTDSLNIPEESRAEMLESLGNFIRKRLASSVREKKIMVCNVSARTGEGLEKLIDALFELSQEGEAMYPEDFYTDQEVPFRISEIIREKAVNRTMDEIPHSIYVEIADLEMKEDDDGNQSLWVRAFLVVENESQKGIVIGGGGEKIKAIRIAAKREIREIFPWQVSLDLRVKVNRNWRKKGGIVKNLIK